MALGGAFVAQADDPSTIFYNPGALGILEDKPKLTGGLIFSALNQSLFQGLPPGRGAGTTGEQESSIEPMIHVYGAMPVTPKIRLGIGFYSPFFLSTRWANKNDFSGSTVKTRSSKGGGTDNFNEIYGQTCAHPGFVWSGAPWSVERVAHARRR